MKTPHDDDERKGLKTPHDDEEKVRRRRKAPHAPHDDEEKERRRRKALHADAKTTEQRSCPGMKMMTDARAHIEPHGVGANQKYPPLDPGDEAPWKLCREGQGRAGHSPQGYTRYPPDRKWERRHAENTPVME